jgi:hypothetical protein
LLGEDYPQAAGHPMGNADKFRKISDDATEMSHYAEQQRLGHGRVEFDELGNAIWVPFSGATGEDVMRRLLDDPSLAFSNEYSQGTQKRIEKEPAGNKKGLRPLRQRPARQEGMEEEEGPAQAVQLDQDPQAEG